MDALERLGYSAESLLAGVNVNRSDLVIPAVLAGIVGPAMQERPLTNLAARLAAEMPIRAFGVIDYLAVTSETVGAAVRELARYRRLSEAPSRWT